MIQSDFSGMKGSETIRFSGSQIPLVVEPLHDAAGKLFLGTEPGSAAVADAVATFK